MFVSPSLMLYKYTKNRLFYFVQIDCSPVSFNVFDPVALPTCSSQVGQHIFMLLTNPPIFLIHTGFAIILVQSAAVTIIEYRESI